MPKRPVRGMKMVAFELPEQLVDEFRAFADARGNTYRDELTTAIRRHLAYPPPASDLVPVLPRPTPFPDAPAAGPEGAPPAPGRPKKGSKGGAG